MPVREVFTLRCWPTLWRAARSVILFYSGHVDLPQDRPFRILGVQQVAIGAKDKSRLRTLWVDLLGATPEGNFRSESENVDEDIVTLGRGLGLIEVDLMEPLDPDAKPRVATPALNHLGLWVDDLRAAFDWLSAKGVRFAPGGIRRGAGDRDLCFIHPRASEDAPFGGEGVLIELVQAPPEVIAEYDAKK